MKNNYWKNFYESGKFKVKMKSKFAKLCLPYIKDSGGLVVDVGRIQPRNRILIFIYLNVILNIWIKVVGEGDIR